MSRQLRVLVAEDELIVGYDLCDTVAEAGYMVEGPYDDLSSAMLAYLFIPFKSGTKAPPHVIAATFGASLAAVASASYMYTRLSKK